MQEIDYFLQGFFCFILTGYILKCDSGRFFHIHLGIALANAHHAATLCHTAHQHHAQTDHDHKQNNVDQKIHHHIRCRIRYLLFILNTCFIQSVRKGIILHNTGIILLPCHITEQTCTVIAAVLTAAVVVICYRTFDHIAKQYGVDYAIKKDKTGEIPRYLVFFKARDADALTAAFTEYTGKKEKAKEKPSVIRMLRALRAPEIAKDVTRVRNKDKGLEL